MSLRDAFLTALAENEDDLTTRLVYADWLDDQGEHEEADRQRKWPAAKQWFVEFCRENNPSPDDEDPIEMVISYEYLVELGRVAVAEEDFWISCGNNETMCNALRTNTREFWLNLSILTGLPVPPDVADRAGFSCGC